MTRTTQGNATGAAVELLMESGFEGLPEAFLWRDNQDEKAATIKMRTRDVAGWDNQGVVSGSQARLDSSVVV